MCDLDLYLLYYSHHPILCFFRIWHRQLLSAIRSDTQGLCLLYITIHVDRQYTKA